MAKRIGIKDIAAKVGVSAALVSYVLNDKVGRVNEDTAERIRKAAKTLNYAPNLVAKSLQSGKTNTIGLIVADISNAFFSKIARMVEHEAEKLGYTVIFGSTDESAEKSQLLINALLNRQVDGLIIAPAAATADQLTLLQKRKVPFVLIDRYFEALNFNSIRINNYESAYNATKYLIDSGRKKIVYVTYEDNRMDHFAQRAAGYVAAMKKNKLTSKMTTVSYQHMVEDLKTELPKITAGGKADALFFATHSIAIEALKVLNGANIQASLLSFDENDAFELYPVPINYIHQPLSKIANESVKLLSKHIDNFESKKTIIELATELIIKNNPKENKLKKAI